MNYGVVQGRLIKVSQYVIIQVDGKIKFSAGPVKFPTLAFGKIVFVFHFVISYRFCSDRDALCDSVLA